MKKLWCWLFHKRFHRATKGRNNPNLTHIDCTRCRHHWIRRADTGEWI